MERLFSHHRAALAACAIALAAATAGAVGENDPASVVAQWSDLSATHTKIIDINFNDATWPDTWGDSGSGIQCPEFSTGRYVNAILTVPALTAAGTTVDYPVMFHNCIFATSKSNNGLAGATAAFSRQYYEDQKATNYNDWKQAGHTAYLEDNITLSEAGRPVHGEAGFVQMCRNASADGVTSLHGWMEIDHIPYIHTLQWSWSSTSWGRGIKLDYKVGDGDWQPLVWMGSEKQKQGWTVFSDQGYFMENVIDAADVSLRWRVWDGDGKADAPDQVQTATHDWQAIDPLAQRQAPRVHKIKIYGTPVTQADADNARANAVGNPGELSDLSQFTGGDEPGPDDPAEETTLAAFPTAEGFGKYATGGRGGRVVKVTSVKDDGSAGTLRWAFGQYKDEPITILFDTGAEGNVIALNSELRVNRANWTLAGQSQPGGITITRNKVNLGGSQNFIVRNVRFRIGQKDVAGNILAENAVGAENCSNFIFDHCSFGWSVEENMNTADSHFLTVQWSIVHEGLYNAGHSKGARGYGCQWGGSPATYHHNLLAHNNSRSCRFNGARGEDYVVFMEYANNVNYNYGKRGACYGGENTADISAYNGLNSAHECNFMNNYYKPGANSDADRVEFVAASYARDGATSWAPSKWWVDGNVAEGFDAVNADNWLAMTSEVYPLAQIKADDRITPALPYYRYTAAATIGNYDPARYMLTDIETAAEAYASVVAAAGTVERDAVEARVANDAATGTNKWTGGSLGNGILDLETQAEGFDTTAPATAAPADSDGDGMPDEWEAAMGLDPAKADNNRLHRSGYTALELYLCSLMGDAPALNPGEFDEAGVTLTAINAAVSYNAATATLAVPDEAHGSTLSIYATDGTSVATKRVAAGSVSLAALPAGTYILALRGTAHAPVTLKIRR